jgi:transketolase
MAWTCALERRDGPSALLLSRQNVAFQPRTPEQVAQVRQGGYVLADAADGNPAVVLIATGSELDLAIKARTALQVEGIGARVVSMPCASLFDRQDAAHRAGVLPSGVPRVAIEAGVTDYWRKYVGAVDDGRGAVIGIDRFGESAPAGALYKYFGITVENVVAAAKSVIHAG